MKRLIGRQEKFMEAFDHIKDQIDRIYKELTRSDNFRQGGSAYLTLEDQDVLTSIRPCLL